MRIYIANLSYELTEEDLRQEFMVFGEVASVDIITDRYNGRSKGFGFVEMASRSEAEAAITGLNGKTMKDRTIVASEARPRTNNRSGGSYDSNRGGSFNRGRGGGFGGDKRRRY